MDEFCVQIRFRILIESLMSRAACFTVPSPQGATQLQTLLRTQQSLGTGDPTIKFGGTLDFSVEFADQGTLYFVAGLARLYRSIFHKKSTATRDGPWCSLIAAVLSKRHYRQINNERAYEYGVRSRNAECNETRGEITLHFFTRSNLTSSKPFRNVRLNKTRTDDARRARETSDVHR